MARRAAAGRRVGCVVGGAACRRGACRCGASALGAVWRAASALRAFWKNAVTGRAPEWLTVCREGAAGCEVRARTPMSKPTTRHHDARRRARCSGAQTVVTGRSDVLPVPPCRSGLGTTHPPYPVPPPCPASAASAAGRDPSATPHASPLHQQTAGHTQTRPSGGTGMRNAPSGARTAAGHDRQGGMVQGWMSTQRGTRQTCLGREQARKASSRRSGQPHRAAERVAGMGRAPAGARCPLRAPSAPSMVRDHRLPPPPPPRACARAAARTAVVTATASSAVGREAGTGRGLQVACAPSSPAPLAEAAVIAAQSSLFFALLVLYRTSI